MEKLSTLAQTVLEHLEPDHTKWDEWIEKKPLYPVSCCEEMQQFIQCMQEAKINKKTVFIAGDYDCGATRF